MASCIAVVSPIYSGSWGRDASPAWSHRPVGPNRQRPNRARMAITVASSFPRNARRPSRLPGLGSVP